MTDSGYELLGSAEKHIRNEFIAAVTDSVKNAEKLLSVLNEIDTSTLDELLLDSKKKESVIMLLPSLQQLASNLSNGSLIPVLAKIITSGGDKKDA